MPALPSAPPAPHALLASPLVGLAILLALVILVSSLWFAVTRISQRLQERRAHRSDVENGSGTVSPVVDVKAKVVVSKTPAAILLAARLEIQKVESRIDMHKCVAMLHGRVYAEVPVPVSATATVPATKRFLAVHGQQQYTPAHVGAQRKRSLPGPSSLRVVTNAVDELKGASIVAEPLPAVTTVVTRTKTRSPKRPRALLLAALANGYQSDSDSDSEYDQESNVSAASLTFTYDATRGVWTTAIPSAPGIGSPAPISAAVESASVVSVSVLDIAAPAPTPARPLVDSRLRNLRLAAKLRKQGSTTPAVGKRDSKRKSVALEDKENMAAVQI